MSLKDDPPILDCSDFKEPRVVWLTFLLFLRAMLQTCPPILGPILMASYFGAWALPFFWLPLAFSCWVSRRWPL